MAAGALIVIGGQYAACAEGYSKVHHAESLTGDFNKDAGGKYIWLCVKNGDADDGITDLIVVATDSMTVIDDGCGGLEDSGFRRITHGEESNGNFCQDSKGKNRQLVLRKEPKQDAFDGYPARACELRGRYVPYPAGFAQRWQLQPGHRWPRYLHVFFERPQGEQSEATLMHVTFGRTTSWPSSWQRLVRHSRSVITGIRVSPSLSH